VEAGDHPVALRRRRAAIARFMAELDEVRLTRARLETCLADEAAAKAKQFADAWNNAVKSIAQVAIQPTNVSDLDMLNTKLGTYANKWDEVARRLKAVAESGMSNEWANPERWKDMTPPPGLAEAYAKGEDAVRAFALSEIDAFYNGQRINEINPSGLATNVHNAIFKALGDYEQLKVAQDEVIRQLNDLKRTDPSKYNEFLQAEGLSQDATQADIAQKAYKDLGVAVGGEPGSGRSRGRHARVAEASIQQFRPHARQQAGQDSRHPNRRV